MNRRPRPHCLPRLPTHILTQAAAGLLFTIFVLSLASVYFTTRAVAEIKQKQVRALFDWRADACSWSWGAQGGLLLLACARFSPCVLFPRFVLLFTTPPSPYTIITRRKKSGITR